MPSPFIYPSVQARVSEPEWQARVELAAFYRIVARYGMTDLTNNHITYKVPDTDAQFLINPFGLSYEEITASCLIRIDSKGEMLLQPDPCYGINPTGFVIHGAIHAARPEIKCIAHTHTRAGTAVSSMECGLLMFNQTALSLLGTVGYHAYEGLSLDRGEQARLADDLGRNYVLVLRNHGLLACGRSVAEAFIYLYNVEMSCRIQVDALASGAKLTQIDPAARSAVQAVYDKYRTSSTVGRMEWAAQLRWLDRHDSSYRE
jgi:ribulose-5-phosphate 4-epimerase/fuculose-1-phosphate aldolase